MRLPPMLDLICERGAFFQNIYHYLSSFAIHAPAAHVADSLTMEVALYIDNDCTVGGPSAISWSAVHCYVWVAHQ